MSIANLRTLEDMVLPARSNPQCQLIVQANHPPGGHDNATNAVQGKAICSRLACPEINICLSLSIVEFGPDRLEQLVSDAAVYSRAVWTLETAELHCSRSRGQLILQIGSNRSQPCGYTTVLGHASRPP
jgi:hypothetical protein